MNSPGNTTYYINPANGDDACSGSAPREAWKSFSPMNRVVLSAGDTVEIIAPGRLDSTMRVTGAGRPAAPIRIHFAPGRYDIYPEAALTRQYHISNTNGDPTGEKAIGLLFERARHVEVSGPGADLVLHGKMIEVSIDGCNDISITDLTFDYERPTVSEFEVTSIEDDRVYITVHRDSNYEITSGRITWIGEDWQYDTGLAQELDLETDEVWRRSDPLDGMTLEEVRPFHLCATGPNDMTVGRVYQIRNTWRDYAGVFTRRSKNVTWRRVNFYYLHGMGIVNQFSENLTFDTVAIAPDPESGRTCAAWADGIQVSGCRGSVVVKDCTFSGAHDDAINIHGTYLRVVERVASHEIRVRFMHRQTYGFAAFNPGDEIIFTRWDSLETYGPKTVADAVLENPKEMLLVLEDPVPEDFRVNDAVENVTWTPEVTISGCTVSRIPTRGFLVATRRPAHIEGNTFRRTHMSAILLGIDAHEWFESGPVRDMTIRDNVFLECAQPVIHIDPHNAVSNDSVHRNIRIVDNRFVLRDTVAVSARGARNLAVTENVFLSEHQLTDGNALQTVDCAEVHASGNRYLPLAGREAASQ